MNGSKRRVTLFLAAVLGALVIGLGAVAALEHLALRRVSNEIAQQERLLSLARRDLKQLAAQRKDYQELSLKLGGRLADCCWSDQMPYMVSQLTGIMEPHGLKIETLQPQPMTSAHKILRFPLRIGFQSDLATLAKVLEDTEKTVPLLEVEQLDIKNAQGRQGRLQVGMTVSSFVVLDRNSPVAARRRMPEPLTMASVPEKASSSHIGSEIAAPSADASGISTSEKPGASPGATTARAEQRAQRPNKAIRQGKRGVNRGGGTAIPMQPGEASGPGANPVPTEGQTGAATTRTPNKVDSEVKLMPNGPPPDGGAR